MVLPMVIILFLSLLFAYISLKKQLKTQSTEKVKKELKKGRVIFHQDSDSS